MIERQVAIGVARPRNYGNVPPSQIGVRPLEIQVPLFELWVGLEREHAVIAIVAGIPKLPRERRDAALRIGILVRLKEETGVNSDIAPHVEEDVVASVAELGTARIRLRGRLVVGIAAGEEAGFRSAGAPI